MKLFFWNVRGLGAISKRAIVKDVLEKVDPNVVIMSKSKLDCVNSWLVILYAMGSTGGILLMWKEDSVVVEDSLRRVLGLSSFQF